MNLYIPSFLELQKVSHKTCKLVLQIFRNTFDLKQQANLVETNWIPTTLPQVFGNMYKFVQNISSYHPKNWIVQFHLRDV